MSRCIFCKNSSARFTTREHILPESLGGGDWAVLPDGIHLFLISLGYRAGGTAAIVSGEMFSDIPRFAAQAVDPIPQALVLTSIVINICILALALSLSIYAYRHYKTLNPFKMRRLRG